MNDELTEDEEFLAAKTGICPRCGDATCSACERCHDHQEIHPGCARAPYYRPAKAVAKKEVTKC